MKQIKKILIVIFALVTVVVFFLYGPIDYFRNLWINTAMNTVNYKFLADVFYSQSTIDKVMKQSFVNNVENTHDDLPPTQYSDKVYYAALGGTTFKGHIIKIENPKSVNLLVAGNQKGELIEDLIQSNNYLGGINASGYIAEDKRGDVWGYTVADGKVINRCDRGENQHFVCGMNQNGKLVVGRFDDSELEQSQFLWAVEFGPVLIVNGKENEITYTSGGLAPRSAIGQTKDGAVLLVVTEGRKLDSLGATYKDIQTIMSKNGAVDAFMLDGGSSAGMYYDGKVISCADYGEDTRRIPTCIAYK